MQEFVPGVLKQVAAVLTAFRDGLAYEEDVPDGLGQYRLPS